MLGTFAIYYREPGQPTALHRRCIALATSLAAIAISRQRADAALRVSESRHRRLVESNIIGVMIAHTDGRITEANDLFLRTVGFTREDLEAGRVRWDAMTPPEWRAVDEHILRELNASGVCAPVEKEYVRKDGTRVPILAVVAMLEGTPGECICLIEDLTGRQRAEAALREVHDRLVKIVATAPGIVCSFRLRPDGSACFPYGGERLAEHYGIPPGRLAEDAAPFFARVHPDDLGGLRETIAESARRLSP